jgi:SAM-dependent methyltransferase
MSLLTQAADRVRWKLLALRRQTGWDERNWLRLRQIEAFEAYLDTGGRSQDAVLEISPGWNSYWKTRCSNYRAVNFPDFDICRDRLPETFRTVIADQVLEHVPRPADAVRNIYAMVADGGSAMVATPFLFRVHARPYDFNRWTPAGLRQLLVDGGFAGSDIETHSWGNKACARAHIGGSVRDVGWGRDLSNDDEYPVMVWAFARKPVSNVSL